jgi:hypothetical protein
MSQEMPGFIEPPADMLTPPGVDPIQALLGSLGDEGGEDDAELKKKEEDKVRLLFKRIATAKEFKKKWEEDYEVDRCHDYVRGFQRDKGDELDAQGEKKYVINKILASLKTRIPALFYYFPYVRVRPARGRADSPMSQVQERAELLQDTVNTIIRQPKTRLKPETMMALKEAHWAFGVIESGYDADWGENPYKQKPVLIENEDVRKDLEEIGDIPEEGSMEEEMSKLKEVPHAETFYVKHIPARQFYVATNDRSALETQDWFGYWEWMYVEDVKRCESFENTEDIKANAKMAEGAKDSDLTPIGKDDKTKDVPPDMVRVWKIWDQREKKRYVVAEGHDRILKETGFYFHPLSILRFEVMPGEWYPIPPIYQQLTEQDETNDSREWLRIVRKGTRPRYVYDKMSFPSDELEKLENDEFFTMVATENGNMTPIVPVQMPQISDAVIRTLALADSAFAEQAASSPIDRQTRGAGGKPTATEVEAMGEAGNVRDSYEQQEVAEWLASIASSLIKVCLEKMTLPQWVLINTDPTSQSYGAEVQVLMQQYEQYKKLMSTNAAAAEGEFSDAEPAPPEPPQPGPPGPDGQPTPPQPQPPKPGLSAVVAQQYQEVTAEQLQNADDGMQWDITVDVESLSPVTEEQHGNKILQALNLLAAPGPGQLLAMSPPLLKNVLNLMGIRNAADQQNIFMALQQKMQMEQAMMMGGGGAPPGVAPMPGGGNPNKQGSGPEQTAPQGGAPAKPGGPQPNTQQG